MLIVKLYDEHRQGWVLFSEVHSILMHDGTFERSKPRQGKTDPDDYAYYHVPFEVRRDKATEKKMGPLEPHPVIQVDRVLTDMKHFRVIILHKEGSDHGVAFKKGFVLNENGKTVERL